MLLSVRGPSVLVARGAFFISFIGAPSRLRLFGHPSAYLTYLPGGNAFREFDGLWKGACFDFAREGGGSKG